MAPLLAGVASSVETKLASPATSALLHPTSPSVSSLKSCRDKFDAASRLINNPDKLPGKIADELSDAIKHRLLIAGEGPMIGAVELDEARPGDVFGEMSPGTDADGAVATAVEHQRRNGNPPQNVPHIRIPQGLQHTSDGARA